MLEWAARKDTAVETNTLHTEAALLTLQRQGLLSSDPVVVSFHLWVFLNLVLDGHAFDVYEGCPPENGLEVWRRLMRDHTKRTPAETFRLEEPAPHPHKCDKQADLPQHIVKWEAAVRRYHESLPATWPDRLSERRQVYALMRILPQTITDKVIW